MIVNTGNGDAFQTGLDVAQLATDKDALREQSRRTKRAELKLTAWHNEVWKPVIAAVNGVCAGGGLHFVADADIVIASSDATFLDPHVSIGRSPRTRRSRWCGSRRWRRSAAWRSSGRHERIDRRAGAPARHPVRGRRPPERAARRARASSPRLVARNSPAAMAATKRALWGALELGLTDACRAGARELVGDVGPSRPDRRARGVRREAESRSGLTTST